MLLLLLVIKLLLLLLVMLAVVVALRRVLVGDFGVVLPGRFQPAVELCAAKPVSILRCAIHPGPGGGPTRSDSERTFAAIVRGLTMDMAPS